MTQETILTGMSRFILANAGYDTEEKIRYNFPDFFRGGFLSAFLKTGISKLNRSEEFKEFFFMRRHLKWCVIGDYDTDGVMATSIIVLSMKKLGIDVFHIIPNRITEGYGIEKHHIDKALESGAQVIITCDNGISSPEAMEYALEKGLDVVITDHHLPNKDTLPNVQLIIDTHLNDDAFPNICGSFIALKLMLEILDHNDSRFIEAIGAMAGIATVGDMMPIVGENRLLVKYALDNINFLKRRNLWNITTKIISGFGPFRIMQDSNALISEETIAFHISPTINSQGRVKGDVNCLVQDIVDADENGVYINGYYDINKERKRKSKEIIREHQKIKRNDPVDVSIINTKNFDYPISGLTGILANRVADLEKKPAFVGHITDEGFFKLSGRTVGKYSIYEATERIKQNHPELNIKAGGHSSAIGVELQTIEDVDLFRKLISEDYIENRRDEALEVLRYDPEQVDDIIEAHYQLAPFGERFKKPKFIIEDGYIDDIIVETNQVMINGDIFKVYYDIKKVPPIGTHISLVFAVSILERNKTEFKVLEIKRI